MPVCSICKDLQADSVEASSSDQSVVSEIRLIFELEVPVQQWLKSVEAGCTDCHFVWNIIKSFNKELASRLEQPGDQSGSSVSIILEAWSGLPLLLALDDLPAGIHFPNLELYTQSKSSNPFTAIGYGEHVHSSLDLSSCVQLSRDWMSNCLLEHAECKSKHRGKLPTRVLRLKSTPENIAVNLHISTPGQTADYIALSYCWGTATNLKTTSTTIDTWKAGIPWDQLPLSFRHAASIAVQLGIEYLWIDSLCIIQDDKVDWEREAGRMAQVYENALITIATDAAKDPTQGILVQRSTQPEMRSEKLNAQEHDRINKTSCFYATNKEGRQMEVFVRELHQHFDLISTSSTWDLTYPLLFRAWTLQERLLASRTLHFTAYELVWECRRNLLCECGTIHRDFCGEDWRGPKIAYDRAMAQVLAQSTITTNGVEGRPLSKTLSATWARIVHGYSSRRLTHASDKLPAISGIATKFASLSINGDVRTYLAGLWKQDLSWLLCWRTIHVRYNDRLATYAAPTWSWASIESPVIWDTRTFDTTSKVNILDAATISAGLGQNQFGSVRGGYIALQGLIQPAIVDLNSPHSAVLALVNSRGEKIYFVPDHNPPDLPSQKNFSDTSHRNVNTAALIPLIQRTANRLEPGDAVFCLFLLHDSAKDVVYGLVLASAENDAQNKYPSLQQNGGKLLERIGIITEMSYQYVKNEVNASAWFKGSKLEMVNII